MKARPITAIVYTITVFNAECWISCYPQQKWEVSDKDDRMVTLSYKNITLRMPIEEYEKKWKEVE